MNKEEVNNVLSKVKENDKLLAFCDRIIKYNAVFNSLDSKYMFLVSLVNANVLLDKEDCEKSKEVNNFIKQNVDLFDVDEKTKEEIIRYVDSALEMINKELLNYE